MTWYLVAPETAGQLAVTVPSARLRLTLAGAPGVDPWASKVVGANVQESHGQQGQQGQDGDGGDANDSESAFASHGKLDLRVCPVVWAGAGVVV